VTFGIRSPALQIEKIFDFEIAFIIQIR
jgi:hypothetical protein